MDQDYSIGSIKIHSTQGVTWPYDGNGSSIDHILPTLEALKKSSRAYKAPVYLDDDQVGYVQNVSWSGRDQRLCVFFYYDHDYDLWNDAPYFLAVPTLQVSEIGCGVCGDSYLLGQTVCGCIRRAPFLFVNKVHIISVRFYDMRHENMDVLDSRASMIARLFGGAASAISILDAL